MRFAILLMTLIILLIFCANYVPALSKRKTYIADAALSTKPILPDRILTLSHGRIYAAVATSRVTFAGSGNYGNKV